MRTIQMTLDDDLVTLVDRLVRKLNTTRSEFTRRALRHAIAQIEQTNLEAKHRRGYKQKPVAASEFSVWEGEQKWVQ
ncbi:MAG: ribbon-helix-helix domain-containing protein [bacterium]